MQLPKKSLKTLSAKHVKLTPLGSKNVTILNTANKNASSVPNLNATPSNMQINKRPCTSSNTEIAQNMTCYTNIPTQNRFQPLATEDSMEEPSAASTLQKEKIPPICLKNIENYQLLLQSIQNYVQSEFHTELKGSIIKVYASTSHDFRSLTTYFDSIRQQYYTYKNPSEKKFSAVIRNVPYSLSDQEIKVALEELNYPVHKVTRLLGKNKQPTPLCAIELDNNDQGKSILNLSRLFYSVVKVEIRRQSKEIPQCTRCQNFGHTKNYCQLEPRCVRCLEAHHFSQCPNPKTIPPKCVNCQQQHPANYRGCEHYLQLKEKLSRGVQLRQEKRTHVPESSQPLLQRTEDSQHQVNPSMSQPSTSKFQANSRSKTYANAVKGSFDQSHRRPISQPAPESSTSSLLTDLLSKVIPHIITLLTPFLSEIKDYFISSLSSYFQNGSK